MDPMFMHYVASSDVPNALIVISAVALTLFLVNLTDKI